MRWVLALSALLAASLAAYFMYFDERPFSELDGAKVGMELDRASETLEESGWTMMHSDGCGGVSSFVNLRRPDHALILTANEACDVTKIIRKPRKLEL